MSRAMAGKWCADATPQALHGALALARIAPTSARLLRVLYALQPACINTAASAWQLAWALPPPGALSLLLRLRLGPARWSVGLEPVAGFAVWQTLLPAGLPSALRTIRFTDYAAPLLDEIEALCGHDVQVIEVVTNPLLPTRQEPVWFELHELHGPRAVRGFIRPDNDVGSALLERMAGSLAKRRSVGALRLPWCAVIGRSTVRWAALAELACEDVLIVESVQRSPAGLVCALGDGTARNRLGSLLYEGRALRLIESTFQGGALMDDHEAAELTGSPALHAIQVPVRFELARWDATLAQMAALMPGAVLDTGADLRDPQVTIWIERRCIGIGQLIGIGDRLGVRIREVSVAARDGAAGAPAVTAAGPMAQAGTGETDGSPGLQPEVAAPDRQTP